MAAFITASSGLGKTGDDLSSSWKASNYGVYRLEAPGDMVTLAYHAGLGAKNSIGFGTIRRDIALEQSE